MFKKILLIVHSEIFKIINKPFCRLIFEYLLYSSYRLCYFLSQEKKIDYASNCIPKHVTHIKLRIYVFPSFRDLSKNLSSTFMNRFCWKILRMLSLRMSYKSTFLLNLSGILIYEPILIKIYVNANIMKT